LIDAITELSLADRHRRKITNGHADDLEVRGTGLHGRHVVLVDLDHDLAFVQLADDAGQATDRQGRASGLFDVTLDVAAFRNVEICRGHAKAVIFGLDHRILQDLQGPFTRNHILNPLQAIKKLGPDNGKLHFLNSSKTVPTLSAFRDVKLEV